MSPTQSTQPNNAVLLDRLERLSVQIQELTEQVQCLNREQSAFIVQYTKAHAELSAEVKRVSDVSDRAHSRIDKLTNLLGALAIPIALGMLGFLWALLTHTLTIGGAP